MSEMQALLVATDFSADANQAVRRAALLARDLPAALSVMHVVDEASLSLLQTWLTEPVDLGAVSLARAAEALDQLVARLKAELSVDASTQLRQGRVLDEILAAHGQASLLVIGARGANALREFVLGTTADRLLRKAHRPLLVVRREPAEAYRRVLVPVDFSEHAQAALRCALAVAPQAQVWVVHASRFDHEGRLRMAGVDDAQIARYREQYRARAEARIEALLSAVGADRRRVGWLVAQGDPACVVLEKERELGADLIAIGKHGQSLIEDTLLGSVTRHLLSNAGCDVLVVPSGAVKG